MTCTTFSPNYVTDNLESSYGTDWTDTYTYQDSTGTAIDITGYTIKMYVKANRESVALITATATLTAPTSGQFTLLITEENIDTLTRGEEYFYEIEITTPSNIDSVYIRGQIKFT